MEWKEKKGRGPMGYARENRKGGPLSCEMERRGWGGGGENCPMDDIGNSKPIQFFKTFLKFAN
jgi:hypothetical protein